MNCLLVSLSCTASPSTSTFWEVEWRRSSNSGTIFLPELDFKAGPIGGNIASPSPCTGMGLLSATSGARGQRQWTVCPGPLSWHQDPPSLACSLSGSALVIWPKRRGWHRPGKPSGASCRRVWGPCLKDDGLPQTCRTNLTPGVANLWLVAYLRWSMPIVETWSGWVDSLVSDTLAVTFHVASATAAILGTRETGCHGLMSTVCQVGWIHVCRMRIGDWGPNLGTQGVWLWVCHLWPCTFETWSLLGLCWCAFFWHQFVETKSEKESGCELFLGGAGQNRVFTDPWGVPGADTWCPSNFQPNLCSLWRAVIVCARLDAH